MALPDINEKDRLLRLFSDTMRDAGIYSDTFEDVYRWTSDDEYPYDDDLNGILCEYDVQVCSGASKIVFKFWEESQWVFKVPLLGESWREDDESPEYYDYFSNIARNFDFSEDASYDRPDEDCCDYCELEAYVGSYVSEHYSDIAEMFAMTYYIGTYGRTPIYVSERCDTTWTDVYNDVVSTPDFQAHLSNSRTPQWNSSHRTAELTVDTKVALDMSWGEAAASKLCQLITDIGITDIHGGNLAYDERGKLRLIDYSGYCIAY